MTPDALLAEIRQTHHDLQRAFAALPDMMDLPGTLTERQKGVEHQRRVRLPQNIAHAARLADQLAKAISTITTLTPHRDRLLAAQQAIEQMHDSAPDVNTIADRREQTAEWTQQNGLRASLTAIEHGCEWFNGVPALPEPLRGLLTDTCSACGHVTYAWTGPLPDLEQKIADAEATIAGMPHALTSLRASAEAWLAGVTV